MVETDDAVDATGEDRGISEDAGHDLAEPEGHDSQVVPAQPQGRCPEKHAKECRDEGRGGKQNPERDVDVELARGQDGERVRPDGEEGGVAEVEQPSIADDDVQPKGQQDPDACDRGNIDLGGIAVEDWEHDQCHAEQQVGDVASPADCPQALELELADPLEDTGPSPTVTATHFSGTRMPSSPVGRKTSVRIRMLKTTTSDHCPPPW